MNLLATVLIASLVGSLHCAGMCGAFAACAMGVGQGRRERCATHGVYHLGRLLTYCILGGIAGVLGRGLDISGELVGLRHAAAVLAGATVVVIWIGVLIDGRKISALRPPAFMALAFQWCVRRAMELTPVRRSFVIGAVTTLLPCGWLYLFAIVAAGTGDPLFGMLVMAAFWTGTVPILSAMGAGVGSALRSGSKTLRIGAATVVLIVGVVSSWSRVGADLSALEQQGGPASLRQPDVGTLVGTDLPCCSKGGGG